MEATNPRAVPGGNNPPDQDPLITEAQERIDTADKWLTERQEITDAEMADKASFFISQVDGTHKALDGQRLQEGRDFKAVQDAKYTKILNMLTSAKEKLTKLRRGWLLKEDERLAKERQAREAEAKKAAEEAEAAAKAAEEEANKKGGSPLRAEARAEEARQRALEIADAVGEIPDRAQIKGQYTTKAVGLREVWSAEITDINAALKHYNSKKFPHHKLALQNAIREVIQNIADKDAKTIKDASLAPPGITFKMEKR